MLPQAPLELSYAILVGRADIEPLHIARAQVGDSVIELCSGQFQQVAKMVLCCAVTKLDNRTTNAMLRSARSREVFSASEAKEGNQHEYHAASSSLFAAANFEKSFATPQVHGLMGQLTLPVGTCRYL